jgi:hypothetical protein
MPWRKVLREPCRSSTQHGRAMAIASVEIRGPQKYHSEDLVLAKAMGGFAECVVCGTSVMLRRCPKRQEYGLTYHNLRIAVISIRRAINTYVHASAAVWSVMSAYTAVKGQRAMG